MSKTRKIWIIIGIVIAVPIVLLAGVVIVIAWNLRPLPESQRNISNADVRVQMMVPNDDRTPVMRTYYESDFLHLDKNERSALDEVVGGRLEGELPVLDDRARDMMLFTFKDKDNNAIKVNSARAHVVFYKKVMGLPEPEKRPQFKSTEGDFNLNPDDGKYTLKREQLQQDLNIASDNKPDIATAEVTLRFNYNGKDYVTYTAITYIPGNQATE